MTAGHDTQRTDPEIRAVALGLPGEWIVEDVCDHLDVLRSEWGTHVWHVVRDLVDEGLVTRRPDGFYETALPFVKGPTTYTEACTCGSQLPGYHRMDCGVYV